MGEAAGLEKDGVERDLQEALAAQPDRVEAELRLVRREFPSLPVVCCRIGDRVVEPVMSEAMGIAAKSMGAVAYIDMPLLHADHATDVDFRSQVLRQIR